MGSELTLQEKATACVTELKIERENKNKSPTQTSCKVMDCGNNRLMVLTVRFMSMFFSNAVFTSGSCERFSSP